MTSGVISTIHVFYATAICHFVEANSPRRTSHEEITSDEGSANRNRDRLGKVCHGNDVMLEKVESLFEANIVTSVPVEDLPPICAAQFAALYGAPHQPSVAMALCR
jgi:hypothetical protein